MALPTSRNTTYVAGVSQVKSADLNDLQDQIIALNSGKRSVRARDIVIPTTVSRTVSGTTPAISGNDIGVNFAAGVGVIRIPLTNYGVGDVLNEFAADFENDNGTLTAALKTGATTLFSVSVTGASLSTQTDTRGGSPYTVLSTDALYLELSATGGILGPDNIIRRITVTDTAL